MNDFESRIARLEREQSAMRALQESMDHKLDDLLAILNAAKVGTAVLRWAFGIGAAIATIWAVVRVAK